MDLLKRFLPINEVENWSVLVAYWDGWDFKRIRGDFWKSRNSNYRLILAFLDESIKNNSATSVFIIHNCINRVHLGSSHLGLSLQGAQNVQFSKRGLEKSWDLTKR